MLVKSWLNGPVDRFAGSLLIISTTGLITGLSLSWSAANQQTLPACETCLFVGAYLIPYVTCLMLCGLPLFFLEVAIGQFSGKGASHVWSVCPLMKGEILYMCFILITITIRSFTLKRYLFDNLLLGDQWTLRRLIFWYRRAKHSEQRIWFASKTNMNLSGSFEWKII